MRFRLGRRAALGVAMLAPVLALGLACAGNTRAHPLADWKLYEEPTGLFSFRYPHPPWTLVSEPPGMAHLEIEHRGIVDRPDRPVVETLDVAVVSPPGDLDAYVASRMATVAAAGDTLLCDVPPCAADELETFENEDRVLGFAYRDTIGADAREY